MKRHFSLIASLCLFWLTYAGSIQAADWPRFRGEGLAATSEEPVITRLPTNGPAVVWQAKISSGFGSFAIVQGIAYVLTGCVCYALDAATGQIIWTQSKTWTGNSTPAYYDGRIFIYGKGLHCLDATTGKLLWSAQGEATEEAQSPWVEDGRVFISISDHMAYRSHGSLIAYNATNGALLWQGHTNPAGYSSPVGATIHGVRQIIFPGILGLLAVQPETGQQLWFYKTNALSGGPSPIVCGDIVIASSQALRINLTNDHFSATPMWPHTQSGGCYDTAVACQQSVFLNINGWLVCRDLETGRLNWETNLSKRLGMVTVTLAQDKLILLTKDGRLALVEASPEKYKEICCSPTANRADKLYMDNILNSPALADGRLYFRGNSGLRCVNLDPRPALVLAVIRNGGEAQVQQVISNRNGTAITAAQATNIDLFCSPNPALPMAQWECLSPALRLTNGVLKFEETEAQALPARFYRATETTHP